jgi:hypothetical protein
MKISSAQSRPPYGQNRGWEMKTSLRCCLFVLREKRLWDEQNLKCSTSGVVMSIVYSIPIYQPRVRQLIASLVGSWVMSWTIWYHQLMPKWCWQLLYSRANDEYPQLVAKVGSRLYYFPSYLLSLLASSIMISFFWKQMAIHIGVNTGGVRCGHRKCTLSAARWCRHSVRGEREFCSNRTDQWGCV